MSPAATTPSAKPKEEERIHHFHRYGDLQSRSTDNILFWVNSNGLADVSTVFKNMVEIGTENAPTGHKRKSPSINEVIDIGFPATTLETFLDMINVPKPPSLQIDFPSSLHLREFCEKFDIITSIRGMVRRSLLARTIITMSQLPIAWQQSLLKLSLNTTRKQGHKDCMEVSSDWASVSSQFNPVMDGTGKSKAER
ncbi:hypothetical protein I302_103952 [Kwoniella bestiolae CBS 10118]|uniref:BTB domain-containing protein n=1 Tax=Kwoniella bestiolae CBS 10118 TaxID=1296100 RepID=A0A1B9G9W5_9TREE|nr:hypothetical protein I302_02658 [Kwoniella bestiolae CBS 10118]OCF27809.1 hypothetical protein I302_02658 [Kwoniella bestiolae CBS 10118]